MLRPSATCCNPVQHVATQCNMLRPSANGCNPVQQTQCNMLQSLQPSATNPVQHVAARSADERQRLVADRATFHTGECEMQHVRRVRSGGRGCIHGGVWGAVRRQGVTGEGLSESQVRQSVCRDGTADLHRHRRERHAARTEDQDGPNGTPRPKRCTHRPCEMNGRRGVRASVSSRAGGGRVGEGRRASEQAAARRTGHIQTSPCKSPTTSSSAGATSLPAAPRPAARSSASCMRAERSRHCRLDRCTARNRPRHEPPEGPMRLAL